MNRIVRERYPVGDLPADLKDMLPIEKHVRLVIEAADTVESEDLFELALTPRERVMSLDELFAMRRPPYRTTEEIVADVRRQREECDDRRWLAV